MDNVFEYKSSGIEFFDNWSKCLVLFLISITILWTFNFTFKVILGGGFILASTTFIGLVFLNVSSIKRVEDRVILKDKWKEISLTKVESIESWWDYEFGGDSTEFTGVLFGDHNSKGHTNKINVYIKLISESGSAIIREQIHMSGKFPNNHPYKANEIIDDEKLFKVWDADKCIRKLELQL